MKASLTEVERQAEAQQQAREQASFSVSMPFLRKSHSDPEFPGVKVVRDKSDLVKRFFETSRSEQTA